ncbi:MAG: cell division protein FtsA [Candidatus Omnitrophica bacterium]|nr:cell division protein FtsA [Candidatus Omnitrophota bacterium]
MLNNNYICALDIGASKIAGTLVRLKRNRPESIYFDSIPYSGIKRGMIVDPVALLDALDNLLKNLKNKSGVRIKFVYVSIPGQNIIAKHSQAVIPLVEKGNKLITLSDIQKVHAQARILGSCLEEEIIHQIPLGYIIDSGSNIKNPVGLYSHRLGVDLYLICAKSSFVQNLMRIINQSGYHIKDLFYSGIATSQVVFNSENKNGFNVICDIGGDSTEVLLFEDGNLREIKILPFGGEDLTNALSLGLGIPFELAEEVKRSYGNLLEHNLNEEKEILIKKRSLYKPIKQKVISQIISVKVKLFCDSLKDLLKDMPNFKEINSIIAVGRTILLEGFLEMLENNLVIPVRLIHINAPLIIELIRSTDILSGQKYLTYITCLGIVSEVIQGKTTTFPLSAKNIFFRAISKIKEIYQEYF